MRPPVEPTNVPPKRALQWTPFRRAMGNVLPSLFALPPIAIGLILLSKEGRALGMGLIWVAAGPLLGWLAMNSLGLFQNGTMRRNTRREYAAERGEDGLDKWFVGMATPAFSSIVDPHEDVGLLVVHPDSIEFWGERKQVHLKRGEVTEVRSRPNAHSFVGLGGWISIEGLVDERRVRLLVEPREKDNLLGNRAVAKRIRKRLAEWLAGNPPAK